MIEVFPAALIATGVALLLAFVDQLIEWDRASVGLLAGTHQPPAPSVSLSITPDFTALAAALVKASTALHDLMTAALALGPEESIRLAIEPVGPGRYKLTHTEGTIHE